MKRRWRMERIQVAPFGVDSWDRVVFMTASGAVWKTTKLYDPDTPFLWEDLHELYSSDSFDGEPGSPRPIEDFELIEDVLWHLQTWEEDDDED